MLIKIVAWSIDEERKLRKLIEDGQGIKTISYAMEETRVSVACKIYSLGLRVDDEETKFLLLHHHLHHHLLQRPLSIQKLFVDYVRYNDLETEVLELGARDSALRQGLREGFRVYLATRMQ